MDADGTQAGFDLDLIRLVRAAVTIPVIASGGAGAAADFPPAVEAGADAVLAATVFHFGTVCDRRGEVRPRGVGPPGPLTYRARGARRGARAGHHLTRTGSSAAASPVTHWARDLAQVSSPTGLGT